MNTGRISFDKARFVSEYYYKTLPDIRKAKEGDLLFTVTGSYGIVIPVDTNRKFCFQRHIGLIKTITSSPWIRFVLQSNYVQSYCDNIATGTAQKTVSLGHLRNLIIPIPPDKEQVRIINELEIWLNKVEIIQRNECDLKRLLSLAKSIILNLSIHGKLVPQDPADEPAVDLLKRVNPNAVVSTDTSHYNIPDNWVWVKMNDIFLINPKNQAADTLDCGFVPMASVEDGYSGKHTYEIRKWGNVKKGYCHFQNGDIGVAKISPCFENLKSVIFKTLPNNIGAGTTELVVLRGKEIFAPYFLYLFKSSWYISKGTVYFKGVVGQQRVSRDIFTTLEVPLPPLNEQKRIVAKVDELFAVIDQIKQSLV